MNKLCNKVLKQLKTTERYILHLTTMVCVIEPQAGPDRLYTRFLTEDHTLLFALDSRQSNALWQTKFIHDDGSDGQWVHQAFDFDGRCAMHEQLVEYLSARSRR